MNRNRERRKKQECQVHRETQYGKALDGLIRTANGEPCAHFTPEYVTERYNKWKKVKP